LIIVDCDSYVGNDYLLGVCSILLNEDDDYYYSLNLMVYLYMNYCTTFLRS